MFLKSVPSQNHTNRLKRRESFVQTFDLLKSKITFLVKHCHIYQILHQTKTEKTKQSSNAENRSSVLHNTTKKNLSTPCIDFLMQNSSYFSRYMTLSKCSSVLSNSMGMMDIQGSPFITLKKQQHCHEWRYKF